MAWRTVVVLGLIALVFWGYTSFFFGNELAHWRFDECRNKFGLFVANSRCRTPLLWIYSGLLELLVAAGVVVGSGIRRVLRRRIDTHRPP